MNAPALLSPPRWLTALLAAAITLALSPLARAQLRETEVLLVYDARISDSLLVAEAYAGSTKVPGGVGSVAGAHPRVRVLNLASISGAGLFPAAPDIDYPTYITRFRNPLRTYLTSNNLTTSIRCILLTKGIPHRLQDQGINPNLGDDPAAINVAFNNATFGNFTYASLDSELTLLWQFLEFDESGDNGDSRCDGMIASPFALQSLPAASFSSGAIAASKAWTAQPVSAGGPSLNGFIWRGTPGTATSSLNPGDIYLVCRLDGNTVADVRNIVTRAQNLVVNTNTASFTIDRDGQTFDTTSGLGPPFDTNVPPSVSATPDYLNTYNAVIADGRFLPARIYYDSFGGIGSFIVGPNISFPGATYINPNPLIFLASYGANHSGVTGTTRTTYAQSFNFAQGAVFNTMESYNGRAYGGLGQLVSVPQQQSADFLAAGGTFAIGNVYEPLSLTTARNRQLVQGFLLSNLTWAEAAYNAIPALSWQQIVIGDPLARVQRTSDDINADGKVTIDDMYAWYANPADLNRSGTADDTDLRLLESSIRGFEHATMKGERR